MKSTLPFYIAVLILTLPLASCTHRFSKFTYRNIDQPSEALVKPGDVLLSAQQVTNDVDLLLYALDRGYAGKEFVPRSDWVQLTEKLTALRNRSLKISALCDHIGDALWVLPDAHLAAKRNEPHTADVVRCGVLRKKNERLSSVGNNYFHSEKSRNWSSEFLASGNATIGVIGIKWFPDHNDPAWADFDKSIAALMKNDALLIDMRGNGGGDDTRGYQLAHALVDNEVWGGSGIAVHYRETPETLTLLKNSIARIGQQKDGQLSEHMKAPYVKATSDRDAAALGQKAEYRVEKVPAPKIVLGPHAFQGPIAILVDENCASSCESSLFVLRQHPNAKVFGARTGGYVHFGNVGALGLPESGIRIGIPTKYNEFAGGQFYDKVGFEPDVSVAAGENAFAVAAQWLVEKTPKFRPVSAEKYVMNDIWRQAENNRLEQLGIKIPPSGVISETPFATPLTKTSFVVPQSWLVRRVPKMVFAPALREDLVALKTAMSVAYGGWDVAHKHGWNWGTWFSEWDNMLSAKGATWLPTEDAFEPVKTLQSFQLDNHTTIPLGIRFGSRSKTYVLASAPKFRCASVTSSEDKVMPLNASDAAHHPKLATVYTDEKLTQAHYLAFPESRGELKSINCGTENIALHAATQASGALTVESIQQLNALKEDKPNLRHLDAEVAYLRLPSFYKSNAEIITREQQSWDKPTGKEKALIIDLRGNEGGDAAFQTLSGWVSEKEIEKASAFTKRSGASCVYDAFRWGYSMISSYGLKAPLTEQMKGRLQSAVAPLFDGVSKPCVSSFVETKAQPYRSNAKMPAPRKGKAMLMVVVDNGCGSDCELMVQTLSKLPESVIVGVNTLGVMQYIQPGFSVLPNTRLPFRIALGTSDIYGDIRSVDGFGLDVDVVIDGAQGWSERGLRQLAQLLVSRGAKAAFRTVANR